VKRLRLFGSSLGGRQTAESDIDFLVEFESSRKTFDKLIQLTFLLEDPFQRRVELMTTDALSPHIGRVHTERSGVYRFRRLNAFDISSTKQTYLSAQSTGLNKRQFTESATFKRAFVRSIEIIGEAAKKVLADITQRYPDVEWRAIVGTRDKLIHDYFGVDYDSV
jgi:predicted nucleotidyltransferase